MFGKLPDLTGQQGSPPAPSQRQIDLGGRAISYTLRRSARRSLGLTIDAHGLRVAAPQRMPQREIDAYLLRQSVWVLNKLDRWAQALAQAPWALVEGATLPVLGAPQRIYLATGSNRACVVDDGIRLELRTNGYAADVLLTHLRQRALACFTERVAHYAPRVPATPPRLALSNAATRWGSCSRTGIRLNWRLIHFPLPVVDYVVAHELAHLREMNHSPRFWSVVEGIYPGHAAARAELRRLAPLIPRL